jgi:hypothetical protein
MDERERYEKGLSVRRAVLGDAHVDRSLKNRNEFNRPAAENTQPTHDCDASRPQPPRRIPLAPPRGPQ